MPRKASRSPWSSQAVHTSSIWSTTRRVRCALVLRADQVGQHVAEVAVLPSQRCPRELTHRVPPRPHHDLAPRRAARQHVARQRREHARPQRRRLAAARRADDGEQPGGRQPRDESSDEVLAAGEPRRVLDLVRRQAAPRARAGLADRLEGRASLSVTMLSLTSPRAELRRALASPATPTAEARRWAAASRASRAALSCTRPGQAGPEASTSAVTASRSRADT